MTDVHINELETTVNVTDSQGLLAPGVLERVVNEVLKAVEAREAHVKRVQSELAVKTIVEMQAGENCG